MDDPCLCEVCTINRIEDVVRREPAEASRDDARDQFADGDAVVHDCAGAA